MDKESVVTVTLIHFNDVYNVECQQTEPVGGATRFCTAIKKLDNLNPTVLFSGDIFAPCFLSSYTKGEQMVPVLKSINTACGLYGNHDFDFGVDVLESLAKKTEFPWLMSNVVDNKTNLPLGNGKITCVLENNGKKIGLIGLVELEWLGTINSIDPKTVTFTDYVQVGNELAQKLRNEGCDLVVALTHMRTPNDIRLAENAEGIDIILGGHDHIYYIEHIKGIPVLKSGTDFRDFSTITVKFQSGNAKPEFEIKRVSVTSDYEEDVNLKAELDKYIQTMSAQLDNVVGEFSMDMDGRFASVRTKETNLGNLICDIALQSCSADCAILNSGSIRSDRIHPAGQITTRDLMTIIPNPNPLLVLNITGAQLVEALENGVSKYPTLEGRFPLVAGIKFAFDPLKPPGNRVDPKFVTVGDEYLQLEKSYRLVTKHFLATGHDGYSVLTHAPVLKDEDECLNLRIVMKNYFDGLQENANDSSNRLTTLEKEFSPTQTSLTSFTEGRVIIINNGATVQKLLDKRKDWEQGKK